MGKIIIISVILFFTVLDSRSQGLYTFADKTTTLGVSVGGYTLNNSSNYGPTGEIVLSINGAFDIGGKFAYKQYFPEQNPDLTDFRSENRYSAFINWYIVKCNLSKIRVLFAIGAEGAYNTDNRVTNTEGFNIYTANVNGTFGLRFDFGKKKMFIIPHIWLGTEFYRRYVDNGVFEVQDAHSQTIYGVSRLGFDWGFTVGKSSSIVASFMRSDNGRFGEGFYADLRLVFGM
jgi:hypothetical protein